MEGIAASSSTLEALETQNSDTVHACVGHMTHFVKYGKSLGNVAVWLCMYFRASFWRYWKLYILWNFLCFYPFCCFYEMYVSLIINVHDTEFRSISTFPGTAAIPTIWFSFSSPQKPIPHPSPTPTPMLHPHFSTPICIPHPNPLPLLCSPSRLAASICFLTCMDLPLQCLSHKVLQGLWCLTSFTGLMLPWLFDIGILLCARDTC